MTPALIACGASPAPAPVTSAAVDVASARAELVRVDEEFDVFTSTHTLAEGFGKYLADDAVSLENGGGIEMGLAKIRASLEPTPKGTVLRWKPRGADVSASGDLGYTWGTYELHAGDAIRHGKYVTVWKKRDGVWKAVLDAGNSTPEGN